MNPHSASPVAEGLERWATTREIAQQPRVWRAFAPQLSAFAVETGAWLKARAHDEIWFCGAGTSAFIGETLAAYLNRTPGPARFRAVPTTDLVSSPRGFLRPGLRTLVVSFGRSGNSSESLGTLDLLNAHAPEADRLHITCNGDSALAQPRMRGPGEQRTLVLPPETNDRGFAMTSSYTTMLLAALACFDPAPPEAPATLLARLADAAEDMIERGFRDLARLEAPERAVFLGSGPLTGSARECALKVLELTAGKITTSWDSTLGFRHGPKAVVNDRTLVFVLQSADPFTQAYDIDLADEIASQFSPQTILRLGAAQTGADIAVPAIGNDAWGSVLHVLVAQMLAVIWSERLGFAVDDPFAGRNLTRVVAGVKLYDLPKPVPATYGAIDVGGSKIEAALFGNDLLPIEKRRIDTRKESYETLVEAIVEQARWLEAKDASLAGIGIGLPGLVDTTTGLSITSNLPATGRSLSADISARLGRRVPVENDCKCFALSEANGGAGAGYRTVFGLILGTGVGGGVCVDGRLVKGLNGLPGEVGHFGLPAERVAKYGLPLVACGCGRTGCYETYVSGPGLSRIAAHVTGRPVAAEEIAGAAAGDVAMRNVRDIWLDLLAELVHTIQLTVDADCVVFGGGLSRMAGLAEDLARVFEAHKLPGVRSPVFRIADHGDASGTRGAAILARQSTGA
ncbi:ROK family protein [Shinella sp. CPCC 101442]|uniref:ROK family protein n=1 Tax=Shinella sp. CPCC 101442 TaxID=2932265 RepID=UPI002152F5E5|nr:ROK family protein [Shinella sp. CPCC 101442]MCR6499384.1 ROK family protein [Shinella sp. CPCC 101442]